MYQQIFNLDGREIFPDASYPLVIEDEQSFDFVAPNPLSELGATSLLVSLMTSLDSNSLLDLNSLSLCLRPVKNSKAKRDRIYTDGLNLVMIVTVLDKEPYQRQVFRKFFENPALIQESLRVYSNFYEALDRDFVNAQSAWGVYLAQYLKNL